MEAKFNKIISLALLISSLTTLAEAQGDASSGSALANIPGAKTTTGILASSVDGMSRYLAPDGPIQPAITAIGGLPMRGAETVNNGITRISSGLNSGAQSLANSAGNDGTIRMPGMDAMESSMPASFASLGGMMQSAIQQKNKFIAGQAERGVQAGERLRSMMQNGLQSVQKSMSVKKSMNVGQSMMNSMQDTLAKGSSQIQNQLQESLSGTMNRMQSMQGIGQNVRQQAQGIQQTLTNGLTGTMEHLQRTGQQLHGQIQNGVQQNMSAMSGIMNSMHGSMSGMGKNMQGNLQGVLKQAQNAAQQVTSRIQQAASGPINMLQNLGSGLGSMMQGGGGGGGMSVQSKGRY